MTPLTVPAAYPPRPLVTSHSASVPALFGDIRLNFRPLEDHRSLARYVPIVNAIQFEDAITAIARILAGPQHPPSLAFWRCEQRFRRWVEVEVASEVHNQQAVVAVCDKVAQHEGILSDDRTVDGAVFLPLESLLAAAQSDQVAMERIFLRMTFALGMIDLATLESTAILRRRKAGPHRRVREIAKLREEFPPSFLDQDRELRLVVGEKQKRSGGREFLPLEQHRRARPQQDQSRHAAVNSRAGEPMGPLASR